MTAADFEDASRPSVLWDFSLLLGRLGRAVSISGGRQSLALHLLPARLASAVSHSAGAQTQSPASASIVE